MPLRSIGNLGNSQPIDPVTEGADAALSITKSPRAIRLIEKIADKLGHPKDRPIVIGGHLEPWDAPEGPKVEKPEVPQEKQLLAEDQAVVDASNIHSQIHGF